MPSLALPPSLDTAHPSDIVRWAAEHAGFDRVVVTASFEDAVLVHVASTAAPGVEVVLLDTQYLFAETLEREPVDRLVLNDLGAVRLQLGEQIVADPYHQLPEGGRMVLIDPADNATAAAVMVRHVEHPR